MSNFCPNCGAKIREDAKFCDSCGQKISDDSPPKIELQKSSPAQLDAPPHYKENVTIREMFFNSEGRLNRWRYFKRTLAVFLVDLLVILIIGLVCSTPSGDITQAADTLTTIAAVLTPIPKFFLDVRRLKDSVIFGSEETIKIFAGFGAVISMAYAIMYEDWDMFASMPPSHLIVLSSAGLIIWAIIQFPAGTVGANKYGADPLENKRR